MDQEDRIMEGLIQPQPLVLDDLNKTQRVEQQLQGLRLSAAQVRRLQDVFLQEMKRGLAKQPAAPSSLQMENTYIPELPDGTEDGEFLALDLGGTNLRVLLLELSRGRMTNEIFSYFDVPENLRIGCGAMLFDFLAQCVQDFVTEKGLKGRRLPLGFTFSFPMQQHALDCGVLVTWTKSFNCPSAVGRDAVAMLREAIGKRKDLLVDVVAVLNDTSGTLVQGAYLDPRTAIGLIIATGSNACYLERIGRVEKWEGEHHNEREVIIDIEWGAFGDNGVIDFIKTDFDKELDNNSLIVNSFTFEKYISGKYMGELVRLVLVALCGRGLLGAGGAVPASLLRPGAVLSSHVSICEAERLSGGEKRTAELLQLLEVESGAQDVLVVQHVCHLVSNRAALLLSVCVAGLLNWMDRVDSTIAVDGSMFKLHPSLRALMDKYVTLLAPNKKFQFMLAEDGSGRGAGLVAAIAQKLQTRRKQGL